MSRVAIQRVEAVRETLETLAGLHRRLAALGFRGALTEQIDTVLAERETLQAAAVDYRDRLAVSEEALQVMTTDRDYARSLLEGT